jgi:hypothetical protein
MTDPKQKGTIQEIIDQKYGACEVPCVGNLTFTPDDLDSNVKDEPMVGQGHAIHSPYDGMRKRQCVANFESCPWVMVFGAYFQHYSFHTLNDIPKSVLVHPETQYSLASVILSNGAHFRGTSLDIRNSPGIHLIFDGINELEERVQIISLDDPLSKIAPGYCILELWYVKVNKASSSSGTGTASSTTPPWHRQLLQQFHPCLQMNYWLRLLMHCQLF